MLLSQQTATPVCRELRRVAVVSDIHGNRTALEAVLADLREMSPDLVLHGGDLAHGGSSPAAVLDQIRDLGWAGVMGNTDEMLFRPDALEKVAAGSPQMKPLFAAIAEIAAAEREALGADRLEWLRNLPLEQHHASFALVHARPGDVWRAPPPEASDDELRSAYSPLGRPVAVYAHIHRSFVRSLPGLVVANTGSVSLSYDGDRRAAYLLLDGAEPAIRRVEYAVHREAKALRSSGLPHADWLAKMLESGRFQMP